MKCFQCTVMVFSVTLPCFLTVSAAQSPPAKIEYAIAIHGGVISRQSQLSDAEKEQYRQSLAKALEVGRKILAEGGEALDAVEQTIRAMEDDPTFNAGRGAVFNSVGRHELDASIMDGRDRRAGAVAAVTTVKNPISLARLVMTETRHVLLIGEGADKFADEMRSRPQIKQVPNSYFDTEARKKKWLQDREREKNRSASPGAKAATRVQGSGFGVQDSEIDIHHSSFIIHHSPGSFGTVGCVALDRKGNLAAGTSTGGLSNKKWGRVGDSAIIGAGTYADNATCAVSCTGIGEYFIRNCVAYQISTLMAYRGLAVDQAARQVVEQVLKPGTGGVIALDRSGRISFRFNTPGMARAAADSTGKVLIELTK
jgi:beta-aspartyl-peptidase (threonine type)